MAKTADELRRLPYTRKVERVEEEDGIYFVGFIAEIPSIRVFGESHHEARYFLEETFVDMLEAMVEEGDEVPEPPAWPDSLGTPSSPRWKGRRSKKVTYQNPEDVPPFSHPPVDEEHELVPA